MMKKNGLYPEEQMQIEKQALDVFLFAADFGDVGIDYLMNTLEQLKGRLANASELPVEMEIKIQMTDEDK